MCRKKNKIFKEIFLVHFFFFQAEDGIRDDLVTGVQTCALPIYGRPQRAHRRHSLRELLQELVPALRAAGKLGVLALEGLEVWLAALHALAKSPVEVADHLSRALELLRREILERIAHVLEVRAEHLLLQVPQELLVLFGGLWLDEFVILERAHGAAKVVGKRVELFHALRGELFHGRLQLLVRSGRQAAAIETLALEALDLLELGFELVEGLRKVVALRSALLRRAEALEEIAQPFHATGDAPPRKARHRVFEIAAREQLIGHGSEKLLRLERIEALGPVPVPVADLAEGVGEARRLVRSRVGHAQALNVERVSPRSLFSFRFRWRPSSTNSTAAAIAAGLPVAPSFATPPFIPGIWSACFTYSWLARVGDTCMVAPR